MTLKEAYIERWRQKVTPAGKLYGYPDCCIEAFVNNPPELLHKFRKSELKQRYEASFYNGEYTGFIPCFKHAVEILAKRITLPELITNRDPSLEKFPKDWSHE